MLRITIELLPHGDASRARKLGEMTIANDATGSQSVGNYNGTLHAEYTAPGGRHLHLVW